jgi:hypothetical protein
MKKFVSNLVMFVIFISYVALTLLLFMKTGSKGILIVGAIMAIVYSVVCFAFKRIRSKMTIWRGILSLLTGIWWIYLMTA